MEARDIEKLLEALKLNPEQRARLQEVLRAVGASAKGTVDRKKPGTLRPPATKINMRIRLKAGEGLKSGAAPPKIGSGDASGFEAELERLSPELRAKLRAVEPQLLKWVNASEENARLFAADPLAALRKAVPRLDGATLAALTKLRKGSTAHHPERYPDLPGIEFTNITVDARGPDAKGPDAKGRDARGRDTRLARKSPSSRASRSRKRSK